jgi:undecaprenyl-diphosphatase
MTIWQALILGIVQGITEFFPISSSGHLLLVPEIFGWQEQPLAFDVALHAGTAAAILMFFHRDWWFLIRESVCDARLHHAHITRWGPYGRLMLLLAAGTIPAVIVGLSIADLEETLRTPGVVATMLILVGLYMAAAELWSRPNKEPGLERLTLTGSLVVGIAQACALIPGVSRSGSTIATGMFIGLDRSTAARFSFLLATPVTIAALFKELPNLQGAAEQGISTAAIVVGIVTSFVVGLAAIRFLLRYLTSGSLYPFVIYRIALAALVLLVF